MPIYWKVNFKYKHSPVWRTMSITRLRHSLKSVLDMLLRMLQSLSIIVLQIFFCIHCLLYIVIISNNML